VIENYQQALVSLSNNVACSGLSCKNVSQVGVLLKRLNIGLCKQRHTIPQGLQFSCVEYLGKTQTGHLSGGTKCRWGRLKLPTFDK